MLRLRWSRSCGSGFARPSTISSFDTVCFHCQQASEKYLKCLLAGQGLQIPRTYDLKAIAALVPSELTFPLTIEELAELNPYAVSVRYADKWR